ncbi:MAG: DMT family transporter [Acidobacteriia bacterium]|nr:DMT family transporter [Terriglobia bacterium]
MSSPLATGAETLPGPRAGHRHGAMHVAMVVVTFCWASNIVAGKEALTGFGDLALAQLRILGGALLFALLFLARRPSSLRLSRRQWMLMVWVALHGITLNQLCFIGGIARTSVAHAGLIVAVGPVMVLVLACLLRMEALTAWKFVGMLVSFFGVMILTVDKTSRGNGGYWKGDLILLAGSAVFAYYTILMKQVANQYDALTLNTVIFVLGALLMLPVGAPIIYKVAWTALPSTAWWALAYLIFLGTGLPYLLFAWVLTELSASRVAAFNYIQPVIATALGIVMLGERLTAKVVGGGVLILIGVYLTERERGEEPSAAVAPPSA